MSNIKTKESVKDIKILDKAADVARNTRRATVRVRDSSQNLTDDGYVSPSEYAEDKLKYAAEDTARTAYDKTEEKLKQGRDRVKEQLRERRQEKRERHKEA